MITQDAALFIPLDKCHTMWCVYEVWQLETRLFIGADKFTDIGFLKGPRNNTYFNSVAKPTDVLLMRIIRTGEKIAMVKLANELNFKHHPPCHTHGLIQMQYTAIVCSNGETYPSQSAAAEALSLNQSAISKHMRGMLKHVGGYTFHRKYG